MYHTELARLSKQAPFEAGTWSLRAHLSTRSTREGQGMLRIYIGDYTWLSLYFACIITSHHPDCSQVSF